MKVIIAGCRDFHNYELVEETINKLGLEIDEIVYGGAPGVDYLGLLYARKHKIKVKTFLAEWTRYGKAAGPLRNQQMAEYGDYLLAFWDGQSPGTRNMINTMKKKGKHGEVIYVNNMEVSN